jgi:phospholipase/carboxylesterase
MDLLPAIEIETAPQPTHSVIWLHGLGASGDDFVPIVPYLGLKTPTRFIFPHAPSRPVTINAGYVMPAWYDILSLSSEVRQIDQTGIVQSIAQVHALIDREIARGIPAHRIVLVGFSQGGAMAYSAGLTYPKTLAGVMALSAYLPAPALLTPERRVANQHTPIMVIHGQYDDVVSVPLGQQAVTWLTEHDYQVTWQTYPMAHEVSLEQIQQIGRWFNRHFAQVAP